MGEPHTSELNCGYLSHIIPYVLNYKLTRQPEKPTVDHSPQQLDSHLEKDANEAIRLLADKHVLAAPCTNKRKFSMQQVRVLVCLPEFYTQLLALVQYLYEGKQLRIKH